MREIKEAVVNEKIIPTIEENEVVEETVERPYTLRKLKDSDLMPLLQLIRKLGLKEFKDAFIQTTEGQEKEVLGRLVAFDIADMIIGKIASSASDDIYAFWSGLSGIPVEEIKEMEFGTLPLMVYDSFSEVKNTAFFKVLFKLL